jgi:hypothetical protein
MAPMDPGQGVHAETATPASPHAVGTMRPDGEGRTLSQLAPLPRKILRGKYRRRRRRRTPDTPDYRPSTPTTTLLPRLPPDYHPSTTRLPPDYHCSTQTTTRLHPTTTRLPPVYPVYHPTTTRLPRLPPDYHPSTPSTTRLPRLPPVYPDYHPFTPLLLRSPSFATFIGVLVAIVWAMAYESGSLIRRCLRLALAHTPPAGVGTNIRRDHSCWLPS